ncbi:MAG: transglutaminase domain-containing protein [Oscillospiraceae bacterium]
MNRKYAVSAFAVIFAVSAIILTTVFHKAPDSNPAPVSSEISSSGQDNNNGEIYNTKPISDAVRAKDSSSLSDSDRKIYNKTVQILSKIITDDMTIYDKELAIHDYMVKNISYDSGDMGIDESMDKNSVNPYGALINGKAICSGYTSAFKMFMDIFGVENIVVFGKSDEGAEHAWNMIKLDGEWYHVDVTWDDPVPESEQTGIMHEYFNVTDKELEENCHIWDKNKYPSATSEKYAFKGIEL